MPALAINTDKPMYQPRPKSGDLLCNLQAVSHRVSLKRDLVDIETMTFILLIPS